MDFKDEEPEQPEEIVIADIFDENDYEVCDINEEFTQDSAFKGIKRSFIIFNDTQLHQSVQSFKNKEGRKYRINLKYMRWEPERDRWYAWRLLSASGIGVLLSILFASIWYYTRFNSEYLPVAALLLAVASVISLLLFFYRSHDMYIYKSLAAGVPLIKLDNRKPDLREFDAFLYKLEGHIRKAHESDMSRQQLLAGELMNIRRLKDEGMLTEETYEHARTLIFRHKDYKRKPVTRKKTRVI